MGKGRQPDMSTTTTYQLGYVGFLSSFGVICDNIYHLNPLEARLIKGVRKKNKMPFQAVLLLDYIGNVFRP
jgi:hypothetical protein